MERNLSATSDASSFYQSCAQVEGPLCHCSRQTTLAKSWTDDNLGRRFFKCEIHGFFVWADKEKPHGWQKVSLIEAREQIRRQKEEIKELKDSMRIVNQGNNSTLVNSDLWKKHNFREEQSPDRTVGFEGEGKNDAPVCSCLLGWIHGSHWSDCQNDEELVRSVVACVSCSCCLVC